MQDVLMESLNAVPWTVLLKFSVVAIIVLILKRYFDNFAAYFMFRANKDLGKNVKVVIDGRIGYIKHYSWRFIYITLEDCGNEMIIPITRWTAYKWEVCRNGNMKGK